MAFVVAARFRTTKRAQAIYTQVERALYQGEPSELSAYNLILDGVPHVVVLGEAATSTAAGTTDAAAGSGSRSLNCPWTSWRRFDAGANRNVARGVGSRVIIGPVYGSQWSRPNRITDDPEPTLAPVR